MKIKLSRLLFGFSLLVLILPLSANQTTGGWFVRLIAESPNEGLIDASNVLGELSDSDEHYDSHDLLELEPFDDPYLSVVFKQSDWGVNSGEYNSDFRRLRSASSASEKTWRFSVKSDDPHRQVMLKWESEARLDKMILIDLETGQEIYPVIGGIVQTYEFNMNGKTEREFVWKY